MLGNKSSLPAFIVVLIDWAIAPWFDRLPFGIKRVVFVGDRGILTVSEAGARTRATARINQELKTVEGQGLDYSSQSSPKKVN